MGFRFRQRIKIAPGVYLNLGKKGVNSLSFRGGPFTTNLNEDGVKHTFGLHGTGLSYETKRYGYTATSKMGSGKKVILILMVLLLVAWVIY